MGRIEVDLFTTLDLVGQGPGGPEEDAEGGFTYGGWHAPFQDEVLGGRIVEGIHAIDALLLGRKTFDAFSGFWAGQDDDFAGGIAGVFNRVPKYVASRGDVDLSWNNSIKIGPDIETAVREIRDRHENIHVVGSIDFFQTLLSLQLFDRLNLYFDPILLGEGKKIFATGTIPTSLKLAEPAYTSEVGTVMLRYDLVPGAPQTGDMDGSEA